MTTHTGVSRHSRGCSVVNDDQRDTRPESRSIRISVYQYVLFLNFLTRAHVFTSHSLTDDLYPWPPQATRRVRDEVTWYTTRRDIDQSADPARTVEGQACAFTLTAVRLQHDI